MPTKLLRTQKTYTALHGESLKKTGERNGAVDNNGEFMVCLTSYALLDALTKGAVLAGHPSEESSYTAGPLWPYWSLPCSAYWSRRTKRLCYPLISSCRFNWSIRAGDVKLWDTFSFSILAYYRTTFPFCTYSLSFLDNLFLLRGN